MSQEFPKEKQPDQRSNQLAEARTLIASERTLMAWIRTALSMIGFGFTIYKFFAYLGAAEGFARPHGSSPRNFGLTLIAIGTLSLVAAVLQQRSFLRRLHLTEVGVPTFLVFIVAGLVILIGTLLFFSVLLNTGPY